MRFGKGHVLDLTAAAVVTVLCKRKLQCEGH